MSACRFLVHLAVVCRYERWYYDETKGKCFDLLKSKSWQTMFQTKNSSAAEEMARAKGFHTHWSPNNELRLTHELPPHKTHRSLPGLTYWSNHFNVFHASSLFVTYLWSAQIHHSWETFMVIIYLRSAHRLSYLLTY